MRSDAPNSWQEQPGRANLPRPPGGLRARGPGMIRTKGPTCEDGPGARMEGPGAKHFGACGTMEYVLHSPGAIPRTPAGTADGRGMTPREADIS